MTPTPKILLAIRLDSDKASIFEFPTRERAESFLSDFQLKHGRVDYVLTESRTKGQRRASKGQMRLKQA